MKLEIENTNVWHLNAIIWGFKRWNVVFMKLAPGRAKYHYRGIPKITMLF